MNERQPTGPLPAGRGKSIFVAVGVLAIVFFVFVATHFDPRRARPDGWKTPWESVPLEPESQWALDAVRRDAMQRLFMQVSGELSHCSAEYVHEAGTNDVVMLELLLEADQTGPRIMFVEAAPRPDLPGGLIACVTRALERTRPSKSQGVSPGTRWRLEHSFLLHQADEMPLEPWWESYVPDTFKSGGAAPIHVG